MPARTLAVVEAWVEAVNARDHDRVIQLSDSAIEIVGPRGTAHGYAPLRDWLAHARVSLATQRTFARGDRAVLAQHGVWRSPETDEVMGEADVASVFHVRDGRITRYARYDTVEEGLAAAGLTESDERPGTG